MSLEFTVTTQSLQKETFLGDTMIGAHHSVGSVTGVMVPFVRSMVSLALCLS